MSASPAPVRFAKKQHGLAFWMQQVLAECDHAAQDFAADPVHDLRVALRRCRSMADGLMTIDPDPSWKQMKKAGKPLFSQLGELRDVQVMAEWITKLSVPDDVVSITFRHFLASREAQHKQQAAEALQEFDRKQWKKWTLLLPRRAARIRTGSLIFKHLALERWTEAHELHRRALRNRSQVGFHSLRIGIKRFRYIVENFLPEQHARWIPDLKELQDLLGEVHDLDVLWATAVQINAFPDSASRLQWHNRILEERSRRIQRYHEKMVGKTSLWQVWRAELPAGPQIETAAVSRLRLWASILDPDFSHSTRVANLALQLYAALPTAANSNPEEERAILQLAALLHEVGLAKRQKGHHKATYSLIQGLKVPLGWSPERMKRVAVVARYHRGALPRSGQKTLAGLSQDDRRTAVRLAGILRLANAFDADRRGRIQRLEGAEKDGHLIIAAQGYNPRDSMAESIAAARHLLETVCRRPILVKPLARGQGKPSGKSRKPKAGS